MYMLFIYVLCTYKRCASLFFFHSLSLVLYYVYVQALRTRVSEAYTELDEPTFTNEKLEVSIVFRARTTTILTYIIDSSNIVCIC